MKLIKFLLSIILIYSLTTIDLYAAGTQPFTKVKPIDGLSNVVLKTRENSHYLPDRIIVKLVDGVNISGSKQISGIAGLDKISSRYGITSIEQIFPSVTSTKKGQSVELSNYITLKYTSPFDPFSLAEELSKLPEVQYAEPWFIYPVNDNQTCRPNDTYRNTQASLNRVLADTAWCTEQGDTNVVIGIIDTGVEWNHSDLQANIWTNPGEWGDNKESNGVDDDGNGKIDDYHGWDFGGYAYTSPTEDNNPAPTSVTLTHGTHVAGIASAVTNNGIGVAGMGYRCKILPVKAASDNDTRSGGPYIVFGFEGIVYAAVMGADIISLSWGGDGASQFEQDVIDFALAHGSLVVAAAGNTYDNSIQYPASYPGVISVAGTLSTDDKKAVYSTYNEYVDVSAPGDYVLSTYFANTYNYMSGTSMATPLVAGLAALVKSHFPTYSPLQVGEQIRATCDDINSVNPSYVDMLGKGRVNALKALTTFTPSVRMIDFTTSDSIGGNNNKILQPGETFSMVVNMKNYLSPTSAGTVISLSETDSYVSITNGSFPIGILSTMSESNNSLSPYSVTIAGNTPPAHSVRFKLTITDGSYSDVQFFWVLINPTYATHNANNIQVSLTNISRVGFVDLNNTIGVGFICGGENQLYEGGLMIGYSSTKLVDVVRNDTCQTCQNHDFSSQQVYNMTYPGSFSAQDGSASFSDSLANPTNKIGISVDMYSYAYTSVDDSNYLIIRYDITNKSGADINNLYAGLFMDWDITGGQAEYWKFNRTTFQQDMDMGYAWNSGNPATVYCGVRALDGAGAYRALLNNSAITLTRSSKYNWLSGGYVTVDSVQDIHFVISSIPLSLQDGEKKMIGFALLGAKNLDQLWAASDAAKSKWIAIKKLLDVTNEGEGVPTKFALSQNYPNPFNPSTKINYELPTAGWVTLKVFDVLGREVATLVDETKRIGRYEVEFDGSELTSGVYFYTLRAGSLISTKKLLLMK
ncbi:MAG: S8 family serine peptidase [Ignavibacteriales bacterium]|nr:S8 family serine peptidase [Ignavibacteriales bacterium]